MKKQLKVPFWLRKFFLFFSLIGPGIITASADNDAPGIATYSISGARYGYGFLWIILLITVGEVLVQEMAARMGTVTGKGTADLIRERFGVRTSAFAMACLLIANTGTTLAQFAGVAAVGELFGISRYITVPLAGIIIGLVILRGNYKSVEKILLVLCLSAFSYVITVFVIKPDWGIILKDAITPTIKMEANYLIAVLAVIGTTITPWGIFYLQASVADKGTDVTDYKNTRADVVFGSVWGNIISAFIIITTAATLYPKGILVNSAEEAAMALIPLAGSFSSLLFSIGMLGASLLAVSVLPLSTTYAMCEAFGFERGLNRPVKDAPVFYSIFISIMLISMLFVLIPGIPLFQIMLISQSVNAILLPVILILVLILANDKNIMGKWVNTRLSNYLGYALTGIIFLATVALLVGEFLPAT
ncbi:MAG: Nramp family divalent metal transporter [Chloroflexi bacterium]|jgi:NRAMP (natural resistance-associated macrophage protein)-like metal ion transporter|nr:Nramp family divalent metal transporter [Anaerolineaceae bacterium]NLI43984.1 Nramp family divalent metal transporter [Chloroflexota bacterium]HOE34294.1 Nramp family divalent metal transporter [Anaerolineaceae bacterium]HOT25866.1 Nramp family divalent metal transporter [Anaerolineaceae bacterium]HQH58015.1 Nramp family divalent metal transporter [Anaerolineaceae bacterium]